ncbi:MAG: hypothetical protein VYA11_08690 [Planctomycetota bacterium]|nr:hypothetical protein [Planctomycetota bacterium]
MGSGSFHPLFSEIDILAPHQIERYEKAGIRLIRGKHLLLLTDLPPSKEVDRMPFVFDQAVPQWAEAFDISKNDFEKWQMVGCLMNDRERFRQTGLCPDAIQAFRNGFSQEKMLWMFDQKSDYYRRHLLLHEGVHGFMSTFFETISPPWHAEGMAELLATHWWDETSESRLEVGYFPLEKKHVPMLGRIRIVRDEVDQGRTRNIKQILAYGVEAHSKNVPYGWCWALAAFLDGHPKYQSRFRKLNRSVTGNDFNDKFLQAFHDDWQELESEWLLFVREIDYAYDLDRSAIPYRTGKPIKASEPDMVTTISAASGWQPTQAFLESGETYHIRADGKFSMRGATAEERWSSDPGGITLHYSSGQPLGVLQAVLIPPGKTETDYFNASRVHLIGCEKHWTPDQSGTLYLRINNKANRLPDNEGTIRVYIQKPEKLDIDVRRTKTTTTDIP